MTKEQKFWSRVLYLSLLVGILWVLLGAFTIVLGFNASWDEDFESYDIGKLYEKADNWDYFNATSDYYWVSNSGSYHGYQSGYINSTAYDGYTFIDYTPDSDLSSGVYLWELNIKQIYWYNPNYLAFYFTTSANHNVYFKFFKESTNYWSLRGAYNEVNCSDSSYIQYAENIVIDSDTLFQKDVWGKIYLTIDFNNHLFKIYGNNGVEDTNEKCFWFNNSETDETLTKARVVGYRSRAFFDYFNTPEIPIAVWGITPASETEITDLNTIFEFGWKGLNDWDTLSVIFKNRATGILTTGKEFLIDEIGPYSEMELNLENFDFDRNGKFYFYAIATKTVPEIIEGMYLTGRQSIEFSNDLVDPEYYLTINVGGYTPIFEMGDFMDWYGVEAKFDEPTAMFGAIAGFFEPIFNKIGEFGIRIENYFNVNESYAQGYEIGKAVPYFTYFVGQVELFLGGFPIMKWLFGIILFMTGIFIFRLIFKFIPGLG